MSMLTLMLCVYLQRSQDRRNVVRVEFATHCSLEELIKVVEYLKPKTIYPCALPNNTSKTQVLKYLKPCAMKPKIVEKENIPPSSKGTSNCEIPNTSTAKFQPAKMPDDEMVITSTPITRKRKLSQVLYWFSYFSPCALPNNNSHE
ncbi:hypothetical protein J6590_073765 [Homalodisca vitripennis]|nr:hypothetical protein J6590_073765 [Homalodisca vitripennis]